MQVQEAYVGDYKRGANSFEMKNFVAVLSLRVGKIKLMSLFFFFLSDIF